MRKLLNKILRAGEGRVLKKLKAITAQVNSLSDVYKEMSDEELKAVTDDLRARLADGETLDDLLPDAFAAVREASVRTLGQRHYDVQVMGGAALHLGNIAEMKTGEGKTLVATLAAYLNALSGEGVHVVTVNDYLASYQSDLMGRVFRFLGMTTGCILEGQTPAERREEYAADITYGTNNQFGFDYLRDNMAMSESQMVQRGHNFAIVDEVDSILIDEARTPLIISGPAGGDAERWFKDCAAAVKDMKRDVDYEIDEKKRNAGILEPGIDKVEDRFGIANLYVSDNTPLISYLNNAIKAKELFHRDKDYIVSDGEVLIVDEHTGRVLPGRRYEDGMHQAIEAKEGVEVKEENQTLATITLQNYFRLYKKLSGMTGTAETEAEEFASTYDIGVIPIPTNKPLIRIDQEDFVYATAELKYEAIIEDIKERYAKGQPVLVGSASVEHSELLSKMLKKAHIPHKVLNAKQHEREGSIVAMAGRKNAVTVATNMAGRGTDIMLGGNAEHIAVEMMEELGLDPEENSEEYESRWPEILQAAKEQVATEHNEVVELGGLYVLGSERHDSRRIDNQLRGRAGRQGDPGESRFYLSLDDDLLRLNSPEMTLNSLRRTASDGPLEMKMMSSMIRRAQAQLDGIGAEQRKNVLKYDDVMNDQRSVVYAERQRILAGDDVENQIQSFLEFVVTDIVANNTTGLPDEWNLELLWADMRNCYKPSITADEFIDEYGDPRSYTFEFLRDELLQDAQRIYEKREEEMGHDQMRSIERQVLLENLDRNWREHLYEMDYLKNGIGLRAMAQRNPLVEYKQEGYEMFQTMNDQIRQETISFLMGFELPSEREARENAQVALMDAKQVSQAAVAAATAKSEKAKAATEKILGLKKKPVATAEKMTYSSSAKDGSGQVSAKNEQGKEVHTQTAAGSNEPQMNREQRRAAKKNKKRNK